MSSNGAHDDSPGVESRIMRLEMDHSVLLRDLTVLVDSDSLILERIAGLGTICARIIDRLDVIDASIQRLKAK